MTNCASTTWRSSYNNECVTNCAEPEDVYEYTIQRVPAVIWPALKSQLPVRCHPDITWLQAIADTFPGHNLIEVLRANPALLRSYLRTGDGASYLRVRIAF